MLETVSLSHRYWW